MVRAQNIWNCRELSRCRQIFGLFVKLVPPQCGDHTTKALNCPHLGFGHQAHQGEFYPPRWENWRVRWVWRVANGHLEQHSLSHMVHIIGCISYGPYNMDHFISLSYNMDHLIWTISHGSHHHYHMGHLIWTISYHYHMDHLCSRWWRWRVRWGWWAKTVFTFGNAVFESFTDIDHKISISII